jgi:DNA recombination protein RmuC
MVIGFLIGLALGGLVAWLAARARFAAVAGEGDALRDALGKAAGDAKEATARIVELEARLAAARAGLDHERRALAERAALLDRAQDELLTSFKALSADALKHNNSSFLELAKSQLEQFQVRARGELEQREQAVQHLVQPIRQSLERVDSQLRELERARTEAYGSLTGQVRSLADGQERLRQETGNLVTALRAPHVRGRWGEVQLKRVIEMTGMLEHCDFVLQSTTRDSDGGLLRPDLIVRLPGGKQVVVDAKVPLAAYLDACEQNDPAARSEKLSEHARQLRDHIAKLSAKAYARQFDPAPDFVVMFVPDETFLRVAHEQDSSLSEAAWRANVVLASPTNLFALLRTVAAVWQQEAIAESAHRVHALGQELYERLATMGGHVNQLGRSLASSVGHYNRAVGALESRVLVTARKLESHAVSGELPELATVDLQPRPLSAPELAAPALPLELSERDAA